MEFGLVFMSQKYEIRHIWRYEIFPIWNLVWYLCHRNTKFATYGDTKFSQYGIWSGIYVTEIRNSPHMEIRNFPNMEFGLVFMSQKYEIRHIWRYEISYLHMWRISYFCDINTRPNSILGKFRISICGEFRI